MDAAREEAASVSKQVEPRDTDQWARDEKTLVFPKVEKHNDALSEPSPSTNGSVESTTDAARVSLQNFRHADPTAGFEIRTDKQIARTLTEFLGDQRYRQIAERTGFNSESVRRYMQGRGRIPAGFIAAVSKAYGIDPVSLLLDCESPPAFRQIPSTAPADWFTESVMQSLWPHLSKWFEDNLAEHACGRRGSSADRSP